MVGFRNHVYIISSLTSDLQFSHKEITTNSLFIYLRELVLRKAHAYRCLADCSIAQYNYFELLYLNIFVIIIIPMAHGYLMTRLNSNIIGLGTVRNVQ